MDSADTRTTFKEAFCQYYNCAPEEFSRKALLRCFYPHASPLLLLFFKTRKFSLPLAFDAIEQAGQATDLIDIHHVIDDYRYRLKMSRESSWVLTLRLRLSGKRLLDLFARVQQKKMAPLLTPRLSIAAHRQARRPRLDMQGPRLWAKL